MRLILETGLAAVLLSACVTKATDTAESDAAFAQTMTNSALNSYGAEIRAALRCLDEFMSAFNARIIRSYKATFNFSSIRLRREVIHTEPDKVFINTRFARYRRDGPVIGGYDSMYVVTMQDEHWSGKMRPSVAP